MSRWDNIAHNLFDPDSLNHPGLDVRQIGELGYPIEKWWEAPDDETPFFDRQKEACHAWQDVSVRVW